MTNLDGLEFVVWKGPGRTESQLAQAIFGGRGYQQLVNADCRLLVNRGKLERRGRGGVADPYRYYPRSDASGSAQLNRAIALEHAAQMRR